jgi:hypothetical protein
MTIIERIKRFFKRQSEASHDTQHDRVDAMVKAQERDKRV